MVLTENSSIDPSLTDRCKDQSSHSGYGEESDRWISPFLRNNISTHAYFGRNESINSTDLRWIGQIAGQSFGCSRRMWSLRPMSLLFFFDQREKDSRKIIVIPTETMIWLSVVKCLSECSFLFGVLACCSSKCFRDSIVTSTSFDRSSSPHTSSSWFLTRDHPSFSDHLMNKIISDILSSSSTSLTIFFSIPIDSTNTSSRSRLRLEQQTTNYFFDGFFISASRHLSSILILVALSSSGRQLTCALVQSLGNDLDQRCVNYFVSSLQQWLNIELLLSTRSTLASVRTRDARTSTKRIISIKFNWICVWIVRPSRINLSLTNVSSISNDRRSFLALTEHRLFLLSISVFFSLHTRRWNQSTK